MTPLQALAELLSHPSDDPNDATWTDDGQYFLTPLQHAERRARAVLAQGGFDAARDEIGCFRAVCKVVNETPVLASMLYDLDLMPEQTMCERDHWNRTVRVVGAVMDQLPAFAPKDPT